jgi:hypothetical protein
VSGHIKHINTIERNTALFAGKKRDFEGFYQITMADAALHMTVSLARLASGSARR